jgi:CubicO group peptidase (beta-lactamase class C family)
VILPLVAKRGFGFHQGMVKVQRFLVFMAFAPVCAAQPADCSALLDSIRSERRIPAIAAAVLDDGQLVALGSAGTRRAGTEISVSPEDIWEVASCTKSMTASVAAMLVEDGLLAWDSTVGEVLGADIPDMDLDWRKSTLEQLLLHLGGAPQDPPAGLWKNAQKRYGPPTQQRLEFVRGLIRRDPSFYPGTHWAYSDCGYAIAGTMMEHAAGLSWETLLKERLFLPLGMGSAGFGVAGTTESVDQPLGHLGYNPPYTPTPAVPSSTLPPAVAPAAAVHCSLVDLAKYAAWHLDGANGRAWLLTPESFRKLHTPPPGEEYALGWAVTKRSWAGGTALMHNGDNDRFYSELWLGLGADTAFLVASNSTSRLAKSACQKALRALINAY